MGPGPDEVEFVAPVAPAEADQEDEKNAEIRGRIRQFFDTKCSTIQNPQPFEVLGDGTVTVDGQFTVKRPYIEGGDTIPPEIVQVGTLKCNLESPFQAQGLRVANILVLGEQKDSGPQAVALPNLEDITKYLRAPACRILSVPNLRSIAESFSALGCLEIDARSLETVGADLELPSCTTINLPGLQSISGKLIATGCSEIEAEQLGSVGGGIDVSKCQIIRFLRLTFVGGTFVASSCKEIWADQLVEVQGDFLLGKNNPTGFHLEHLVTVSGGVESRAPRGTFLRFGREVVPEYNPRRKGSIHLAKAEKYTEVGEKERVVTWLNTAHANDKSLSLAAEPENDASRGLSKSK